MKNIKTICTLGPASFSEEVIEKLVLCGMDVVRLNFSHATYEQFLTIQKIIKKLNEQYGRNVKIMMDLQGPRMRVGKMPEEGKVLEDGQIVTFTTDIHNTDALFIDDPYLHEDIEVGHPIYLANGDMELTVTEKKGTEITANVVKGGTLFSRKGVNVPDTNLTTSGLTEKDLTDIAFGVEHDVDQIALSFVQDRRDLDRARGMLQGKDIKLISKVERKKAIANIDEIIDASDIVMVARGDLGIELPMEEIPLAQKMIIKKCNEAKKEVIVATQMLLSMTNHHRPTRAEVSDVANAVFDGADYVMLSDETAFGKYPVESLAALVTISQRAASAIEELV